MDENDVVGKESVIKRKIKEAKQTDESKIEKITMTVVNCRKLYLRKKPSSTADVICALMAGEDVVVESVNGDWAHINTGGNIEGYVNILYIKEK